jgi:hypothetical protein
MTGTGAGAGAGMNTGSIRRGRFAPVATVSVTGSAKTGSAGWVAGSSVVSCAWSCDASRRAAKRGGDLIELEWMAWNGDGRRS